ncbi:MAG: phosphate signaling complex protein PhoU [Defluviitaleaceae bacterium]|nr:phosphate signaling complex protein PhoU [Defluviitaleaceae bacterium]
MGTLIEKAMERAIKAIKNNDYDRAKAVKKYTIQVANLEETVRTSGMKILTTQQPVARDLRLVSVAFKISDHMLRIADQTYNVAEITKQLIGESVVQTPERLIEMGNKTIAMVKNAINSFVNLDIDGARAVIQADDEVDNIFVSVRDDLIILINENKKNGAQAIDYVMISKYMERIADYSVSISEQVIYYITGTYPILEETEEDEEE